jgi:DNA-binding XRE family transcriptional regulator
MPTLAEAVRAGRAIHKLKQIDLAVAVRLSRQSIMAIEHGNDTSFHTRRDSQVLNFSLDSLSL